MTGIALHTTLTEGQRRALALMLREGLGVEDAAVDLRVSLEDVRDCVAYWRRQNLLANILNRDPERHRQALAIMGAAQ